MSAASAPLLLFLGSFGFYLRHVAPSVTAGDSGEFMTTAATLSLAHAPSYPLYTLVGKCFLEILPWAAPSYRMNVLSAFLSSGLLVILFYLVRSIVNRTNVALLFALCFGTTTSFWLHSLVTEVFQLHIFFVVLLSFVLVRWEKEKVKALSYRAIFLFLFLLGLGLGNHQTLIFMIFPFIFVLWRKRESIPRCLPLGILFGLLGFSVNLMLPIRSSKEPPLNWGQPTTLHRFYRTLARKDYGSFSLALGESPKRNLTNTTKQLVRFSRKISLEMTGLLFCIAFLGLMFGLKNNPTLYGSFLLLFLFSGPGFYMLGNLPFTAQSEGIMGRFFIMPVFALFMGLVALSGYLKKATPFVLVLLGTFFIGRGWAEAKAHRSHVLVRDYAKAMLRTLPPNAMLFMDGGDDAFYSLAMMHYMENQRPDVELHDRGGLIYKNIYGDDFRQITKAEKAHRRIQVEKSFLPTRRLYYSTMASQVLPDQALTQEGFLISVQGDPHKAISWPVIVLRSLYPLATSDYRTRALGAFFPFMEGRSLLAKQKVNEAMSFFNQAQIMGFDIDWLKQNLGATYEKLAFQQLQNNELKSAELLYKRWIQYDSLNSKAYGNLGVVLEKQGRIKEAKAHYEMTMIKFPKEAKPVYNLAVLYWNKDINQSISYLEEVLRREPHNKEAKHYLRVARQLARSQKGG